MTDRRYKTPRWRYTRSQVIRRDGPICAIPDCTTDMIRPRMICNDHIIAAEPDWTDEEFYWMGNLQVLCWHHNISKGHAARASRSVEPVSPNA